MKSSTLQTLVLAALFPTLLFGSDFFQKPKDVLFGAHLMAQHIGQIQTDDQGGQNSLESDLFLSVEAIWDLNLLDKNLAWTPSFGLGVPHSGRDENIKRWQYFILSPFSYHFSSQYSAFFGPGLFMTRLSSDGGTAELDNGTSTDRFFLPEESSTSQNLIWSLGQRWQPHKNFSFRSEVIVFNLVESASRTFSFSLSAHYHFGVTE